ncbi:MAG: hypothetical protein QMD22_10370 [archaeon]|nr:hypothetical protein [archaeon]
MGKEILYQKSVKEILGNAIIDRRTSIAILVIATLWRVGISLNGEIALWESICSGIALFILGWALFAYIYLMSRELKGWLELNKIYHWIAVSIAAINVYVIVYYGMRWHELGGAIEATVPLDFLFRNIRFMMLVIFYCVVIWLTRYLRRVHGDYQIIFRGAPEILEKAWERP